MTDSEKLHALAISSKPEWAPMIRARNEWLLEKLELLRPFIGRTVELTDELTTAGYESGLCCLQNCRAIFCLANMGCPHCLDSPDCSDCLYYTVCDMYCGDVPFGGVTLMGQTLARYACAHAVIAIADNVQLTQQEFDKTRRFLQAHIDWTHDPDWGKEA